MAEMEYSLTKRLISRAGLANANKLNKGTMDLM